MSSKIGVGIITCNREEFFKKCYNSIPEYVDELIIVNDGNKLKTNINRGFLNEGTTGKQVGKCKNIAMSYLLDKGCDYIFTL
jgi:glycosyltransferase involved in cell wall biosynthesis